MTDYFVASGGSNTSPYDTWAKAATSLQTALTAASTNGDRVIIQYDGVPSGDAEISATATFAVGANIQIISSTNSGTATITPTAMGTSYWIGNSTTSYSLSMNGAYSVYLYGITFRNAGSTAARRISLFATSDDAQCTFDNCYFWIGNTSAEYTGFGGSTTTNNVSYLFKNCTFRFSATANYLMINAPSEFYGCTISADGVAPDNLLSSQYGGNCLWHGCDLSALGSSNLVGDIAYRTTNPFAVFNGCKLGASFVALAAQTDPSKSSGNCLLLNCDSGDVHYFIGHYDVRGQTTADTGIYANSNIADSNLSWKIVTTSIASYSHPYESPWIPAYNDDTSTAITPSLEIVRSGSATAYKDDEVWSEWLYPGTSGYPKLVYVTDARALVGTAADQTTGALGASDWTGENATSWFGKLAPASSFTPSEVGHIQARICVGAASATVYVDPQIRGLA